jgi:site-specific recombinase XerD
VGVAISLTDFDWHREEYSKLRMGILNHQPSGVQANERDLNLFSQYFHEQDIKNITGEGILYFLTWLREERNNHAGSINRKESSLRSYLKYLRFSQVNGADRFPVENLPRAREPYNGPVEALAPEEVARLLGAIDRNSVLGFRDFFLFTLLYRLGLRIGEAVRIDIKDIDLEKEILLIHGKGRRKRKLPLLPDLMDLLDTWLIYRSRLCNADRLEALFISKKGNRLSIRTTQDNLKKLVAKAGPFSIEKVTPHSLRHAFATHAIEGKQDIIVLKAILGHASSKSTEMYCHPSMRTLKKAVDKHIASEILEELISENRIAFRIQQKQDTS